MQTAALIAGLAERLEVRGECEGIPPAVVGGDEGEVRETETSGE